MSCWACCIFNATLHDNDLQAMLWVAGIARELCIQTTLEQLEGIFHCVRGLELATVGTAVRVHADFTGAVQLWPRMCLHIKLAELAVELNGLKGHDADATSISLSSRAENLQLNLQTGQEGLAATVCLALL